MLHEIKALEINATQCSVSHCLSLKNSRRYHVDRCQNEQTKKNSVFAVRYIRRFYQVIFFSRLHCRVLKVYPLHLQIKYSEYLSTSLNVLPYSHVAQYVQKVPCTSESISGSLRSRSLSLQPAGEYRGRIETPTAGDKGSCYASYLKLTRSCLETEPSVANTCK